MSKAMFLLNFRDSAVGTLLLLAFLAYLSCIKTQTVVDTCGYVHGRERRLGTVRASTGNLVVDSTQVGTFDGDNGRFKRTTASSGFLSYVSIRGFERIQITGYVFGSLLPESWSLHVSEGDAITADEAFFTLNDGNLQQYLQKQESGWIRFRVRLALNVSCPDQITIALNGRASNNEFDGWGLQLSRIALVQSWFEGCTASCSFKQESCSSTSSRQTVDPADNFRDVYSRSKNIRIDTSSAGRFHEGDGRFTRSNSDQGDLLYVSSSGIHAIDIEVFQFRPYNTKLSVIPYMNDDCQPMVLPAAYETKQSAEGWELKIARFNLRNLPMCPTHVLLRIEGGQHGWEMQISRLTFKISGQLENDPAAALQSKSSDDEDDGIEWWILMLIIVAAIVILLVAACMVRRLADCCGTAQSERRLPVWSSRAWRRGRRDYETDIPGTPTAPPAPTKSAELPVQKGGSFTFPVQQDVSLER